MDAPWIPNTKTTPNHGEPDCCQVSVLFPQSTSNWLWWEAGHMITLGSTKTHSTWRIWSPAKKRLETYLICLNCLRLPGRPILDVLHHKHLVVDAVNSLLRYCRRTFRTLELSKLHVSPLPSSEEGKS